MKLDIDKISKWIGAIITCWTLIGVASVFFFGSEQAQVAVVSKCAGWARLGTVGQPESFYFQSTSPRQVYIKKDTQLKIKPNKEVYLRGDYFSPLWWIPFVGEPEGLGILRNEETVIVHDVRTVAKLWLWILVERVECKIED